MKIRCLNWISLIVALTIILSITNSPLTGAQSTAKGNNEGLYKIEMIVFNRKQYGGYADSEFWRRDITLSYPQNYNQLTLMPKDTRKLDNLTKALRKGGQYRVLFHKAWQQQNTEKNNPAIIIQGGDNVGQYHEIEGSIQLRVARY